MAWAVLLLERYSTRKVLPDAGYPTCGNCGTMQCMDAGLFFLSFILQFSFNFFFLNSLPINPITASLCNNFPIIFPISLSHNVPTNNSCILWPLSLPLHIPLPSPHMKHVEKPPSPLVHSSSKIMLLSHFLKQEPTTIQTCYTTHLLDFLTSQMRIVLKSSLTVKAKKSHARYQNRNMSLSSSLARCTNNPAHFSVRESVGARPQTTLSTLHCGANMLVAGKGHH